MVERWCQSSSLKMEVKSTLSRYPCPLEDSTRQSDSIPWVKWLVVNILIKGHISTFNTLSDFNCDDFPGPFDNGRQWPLVWPQIFPTYNISEGKFYNSALIQSADLFLEIPILICIHLLYNLVNGWFLSNLISMLLASMTLTNLFSRYFFLMAGSSWETWFLAHCISIIFWYRFVCDFQQPGFSTSRRDTDILSSHAGNTFTPKKKFPLWLHIWQFASRLFSLAILLACLS